MKEIDLCFTFLGSGHVMYHIVPSSFPTLQMDASGCNTLSLSTGAHSVFYSVNSGMGGKIEAKDTTGTIIATGNFDPGFFSGYIDFNLQ